MRALLVVAGLGLQGCKGSAGTGDPFDAILVQLEAFKTQMCACKDAACTDQVMDARREYRTTMRQKLTKGAKPTAAQDRRGKELEEQLMACRRALVPADGAGSGSAPAAPDPE